MVIREKDPTVITEEDDAIEAKEYRLSVGTLRRLVTWIRSRPDVLDTGVALTMLVLSLLLQVFTPPTQGYVDVDAFGIVIVVLQVLPLAWRRRAPRAVLWVTFISLLVSLVAGYMPLLAPFGPLVAIYTVAAHLPRRAAALAAGVCAVSFSMVTIAGIVVDEGPDELNAGTVVSNVLVILIAVTLGDSVRSRRERIVALEERASLLEQSQQDLAERAVREERGRIARELHDVVAHGMGVMVIQAGAARRVLATQPELAREAMAAIEAVGRESLGEMRRLLGVLRDGDADDVPRAPQPGIDDLPDLIAQCRRAGLAIELVVEGEARPLAPGVDLSAYRIVQEALTNVREHAGPAAACVRLCYGVGEVEVQITDDGRGVVSEIDGTSGVGRGNGIVGMRERVELYGGRLCVGNRTGGGYAVRATLPVAESGG